MSWTPLQRLADRVRKLTADRKTLTDAQAAVTRDEQLIAELHPTKLSDAGLTMIAGFEGLRLTAYKPVASEEFWTIGYGHYGPDVKPGQTITKAEAIGLLRADVRAAEQAVAGWIKVPLTQNQFDALVSLTFNIGAAAFRASTLARELNAGHYATASAEFTKWVKGAGGIRLAGLVKRRAVERALFDKE